MLSAFIKKTKKNMLNQCICRAKQKTGKLSTKSVRIKSQPGFSQKFVLESRETFKRKGNCQPNAAMDNAELRRSLLHKSTSIIKTQKC